MGRAPFSDCSVRPHVRRTPKWERTPTSPADPLPQSGDRTTSRAWLVGRPECRTDEAIADHDLARPRPSLRQRRPADVPRQRVLEEAGDRHRAGAAGHRGDRTCDGLHGVEVDVADDAVGSSRHADVDHRGAGLDVIRGDHVRLPGGTDDDVRLAAQLAQIAGSAVRERHRRVGALAREQQRQRQSDERAPPDDHCTPARRRDAVALQQPHHAERRAADEAGHAAHETAERASPSARRRPCPPAPVAARRRSRGRPARGSGRESRGPSDPRRAMRRGPPPRPASCPPAGSRFGSAGRPSRPGRAWSARTAGSVRRHRRARWPGRSRVIQPPRWRRAPSRGSRHAGAFRPSARLRRRSVAGRHSPGRAYDAPPRPSLCLCQNVKGAPPHGPIDRPRHRTPRRPHGRPRRSVVHLHRRRGAGQARDGPSPSAASRRWPRSASASAPKVARR